MRLAINRIAGAAFVLAGCLTQPAQAQNISFGDDSSKYALDGECDDKRFSGPGMTGTSLLDSDVGHDASDCRVAYEQGRLTYNGSSARNSSRIQWGDDSSKYANDGECDDKRFTGSGMTSTTLLDSDIKHDASDCRTAYEDGRLELRR